MAKQCSAEFEQAFFAGCSGCRHTCACGKVHYDASGANGWDWGEGEIEALEADKDAVPHCDSVGVMFIGGVEIVVGCDCDTAARYEKFLVEYVDNIAAFINARTARKRREAEALPTV